MMHQFSTEYQEIFSKHIFFHISCLSLRGCLNLTATCTWNCEEVQGRCTCGRMTDPLASRLGNLEGLWCHWRRPLPSSSQGRPWVKNMICHQDPESWILGFEDLGFRILKSFWYLSPEITLRPNLAILAGALRGHLAELARRLVAVGLASLPCKVARLARLALASLPCKVGAGCRLRWWGDGLTLERDRWKADGKILGEKTFPLFIQSFDGINWNQLIFVQKSIFLYRIILLTNHACIAWQIFLNSMKIWGPCACRRRRYCVHFVKRLKCRDTTLTSIHLTILISPPFIWIALHMPYIVLYSIYGHFQYT